MIKHLRVIFVRLFQSLEKPFLWAWYHLSVKSMVQTGEILKRHFLWYVLGEQLSFIRLIGCHLGAQYSVPIK